MDKSVILKTLVYVCIIHTVLISNQRLTGYNDLKFKCVQSERGTDWSYLYLHLSIMTSFSNSKL